MTPKELAPEGAIWVCAACGRYGKDRWRIGDESCGMKAVLCREDSLLFVEGDSRAMGALPFVPSPAPEGDE